VKEGKFPLLCWFYTVDIVTGQLAGKIDYDQYKLSSLPNLKKYDQ
jgi:hypothetical protein